MKLALAMTALLCSVVSARAADGVFPFPCHQKTLPNGLKVVMIPTPSRGLVAYFTVVRTGSRDEVEPGRSGYAHFFEHMMFRGTKTYPGPVYNRIVTSLGAQANAFTSDDLTVYHLTLGKEDLERAIEIESDRFQHLDYGKPAFQTEAGAVYGEYRIGSTNPFFALHEKMQDLAFDAHTYKHTTMGFQADIKAMPEGYDYSRSFYHRFYRPENVVILAIGDVDPPATVRLIEKYYGAWQPGYQPPKITPEPPQTAPKSAEITFPGRTLPILAIGYKGDAFDPANRDYVAARLLAELAFGPQSELYKRLVLREQRVEAVQCDVPVNRDQPLFDIVAIVKNAEDIPAVRDQIDRTLQEFQTKPVDSQKLDDLKRRERYEFLMELDAPEKVAMQLARIVTATGGVEAVDQLFAASATITPRDIQRAAAKYFVPERRTEIVLKGKDDAGNQAAKKGEGEAAKADTPSDSDATKPLAASKPPPQSPTSAADATEKSQTPVATSPVLLPVAGDPTISFRLWFKAGSQNDPPGKEGLADITAAMISEGATRSNTYEQILDKLFPLAAGYSANAGMEMTVVSGRVHKDNLERFYPLLIEAILQPAFNQEDLDRVKSRTLSYLENTLRYANNEELGKAVLYNTLFAGTPYGHLGEGTIETVRGITIDDVKAFYRTHYTRDNVTVALGGGYDAALLKTLQADLGALPAGAPSATDIRVALQGRQVTIVEKECPATAISLGFPLDVVRGTKDWYALAIANSWLGQHRNQNGHLYQTIRELRGLNYGDYTYLEHFPVAAKQFVPPTNVARRQQIFEMWIRPVPNTARQFALRAALREFQRLIDHGLTQEQFDETRAFLRKFVPHLAPTTMAQLGYAVDDRFYGINGSHLEKYRQAMQDLTLDEVNAAIRRHLQYNDLQIVFVTKDAQSLKDALVAETPSPITYATPKPDSVIAEDREISVFPLKIKAENVRIVPLTELFVK
ncbi:MAG: pitrilysin family protein [Thermoguttaceae bacterium]